MAKKKKTEEPLVLNEKAKVAFEELNQLTLSLFRYIEETMRQEMAQNAEFAQLVKNLIASQEIIRKKISLNQPLPREELVAFTNNIVNLNERLKQPLKTKQGEILKRIMAVGIGYPGKTQKVQNLSDAQQMDKIQKDFSRLVEQIQNRAITLTSHVKPLELSLWQKFTRACVALATSFKNKIFGLFKKDKVAVAIPAPPPPPPLLTSRQGRKAEHLADLGSEVAKVAQQKQARKTEKQSEIGSEAAKVAQQKEKKVTFIQQEGSKTERKPAQPGSQSSVKEKVKFFEEQHKKQPGKR